MFKKGFLHSDDMHWDGAYLGSHFGCTFVAVDGVSKFGEGPGVTITPPQHDLHQSTSKHAYR